MPLVTVEHVLTTEDRLSKEFDSSYEEAVANAYYESFVNETPGEGAKERLEWLLATAGIDKLPGGQMTFESLMTAAHEIVHEDFGKGLIIPRNQFEDDSFGFATDWTAQMGNRVALHPQDLGIAALLGNLVGYDGVTFFNAAHPLVPGNAALGTYSNVKTSSALTVDNFVAACAQMEAFRTPGGPNRGLKAKYLIVPPALRKAAIEITGAKFVNATENVVSSYGVEVVVAADLAASSGGSDTTWYITTEMPGKKMTKPVIYSRRRDFEMTSYDGVTQAQLARMNQLEWHFRGRAGVAMGHPFLAIRCTA